MRKCWNCGQPTNDENSRVCSDEICQRAEKKSSNGEFRNKTLVKHYQNIRECRQSPEYKAKEREYHRKRWLRPEVKAKARKYEQSPEVKAKRREYNQRPEVKAKKREAARKRYLRPEHRAKRREYKREYHQRPEVKAKRRERYLRKKKLREEE